MNDSILFVPDDIGDTLGTIYRMLRELKKLKMGKPKYVFACFPHALLNRTADKIIRALGINVIASTSNPTRRTKEHIKNLPVFWYDPTPYFYLAIKKCVENNKRPDGVFNEKNYPQSTVHKLYNFIQRPKTLVPYTANFSSDPFL